MEEEEKKAKEERERFRSLFEDTEKHPFLRMPDLTKCGFKRCEGCGNVMLTCHDVVFGLFCVLEVMTYCEKHPEEVIDVVVKKIFIDTYNRCLAFQAFRKTKVRHTDWRFVPPCVQANSYSYALFWYEWTIEGRYKLKNINGEPDTDKDGNDY